MRVVLVVMGRTYSWVLEEKSAQERERVGCGKNLQLGVGGKVYPREGKSELWEEPTAGCWRKSLPKGRKEWAMGRTYSWVLAEKSAHA